MFFKSKKEKAQKAETAPVIEKKELLYRENIRTGCAPATKQEAIMAAGKMLVETGYVEPEYAEAMLEREKHVPHLWETDLLFRTVLKLQRREFYSQGSPYRPSKNRSTGTAIRSAS